MSSFQVCLLVSSPHIFLIGGETLTLLYVSFNTPWLYRLRTVYIEFCRQSTVSTISRVLLMHLYFEKIPRRFASLSSNPFLGERLVSTFGLTFIGDFFLIITKNSKIVKASKCCRIFSQNKNRCLRLWSS